MAVYAVALFRAFSRAVLGHISSASVNWLEPGVHRAAGTTTGGGRSRRIRLHNRSAAVFEALELWRRHRRLGVLRQSYRQLARLEGGDLETALCQERDRRWAGQAQRAAGVVPWSRLSGRRFPGQRQALATAVGATARAGDRVQIAGPAGLLEG